MQTSVEEIGKNKVRLTVEVPNTDVEKVVQKTYRRLAKEVRVPGFRPGKAPKAIIDQRLGRDFVRTEALKELLPDLFAQALQTTDLDVVAPPSIDVKTFEDGQDLTFEAVVETRPEPELGDYTGLPGRKPPVEVTDADVDEQLEQLQVRFATLEVSERPLQQGDFALVDLTTYRHDTTIDALTAKDLLIEVGAEMVVPELDEELLGKRRGDILKVTATLPERFGEQAGWQVAIQVLVKETKTRKLPALDDELAKTVSEFDTLDELKADIRERLGEMLENQAESKLRESVLDAFVDQAVHLDLPEGMVDVEVENIIGGLAQILAAQGVGIEQYMKAQNLDADALRHRFREQAERNLAMRLGLEAVAEAEGLESTEEDREREIAKLASRVDRTEEEVRSVVSERDDWKSIDGDILRSKALDLLVERAEVTVNEEPSEGERPAKES